MAGALERIAVVASTGPWAVGGLGAYSRNLLRHLPASLAATYSTRFISNGPGNLGLDYAAREPMATRHFDGVPVSTIVPRPATLPALALSRRFVHYRPLHRVAAAVAVSAWRPALHRSVGPEPSLIHTIGCGRELLGFAALAEARRRRIPFTIFPATHIGSWGDSPLDLDLYGRADAVFAATIAERDHLIKLGVPSARVFVCGFAPDVLTSGDGRRFRETRQLADRPIVLFVGRKSRSKGYHQLRSAIPAVAQRVPGTVLVAIGADAEPPYPDLSPELVHDLGAASDQVKADALAACDVMCLPSEGESFGIVYIEAWAYGKPIIALDTPASRALLVDGGGILTPDRANGLVDALTSILSNTSNATAIGRVGREIYRQRYTWEHAIDTHMQVFESVLAQRTS